MNTEITKFVLDHVVRHLSLITKNTESNRNTLHKARARLINGKWLLESTDGHRIVTNTFDQDAIITEHGDSICFPFAYLDFLKSSLKGVKDKSDTHMVSVSFYTLPCPKSDYPDTDHFINASTAGYNYTLSFNAEYLEEMLRAMREHKRTAMVTLSIKSPTECVRVKCGDGTLGILMPMRGLNAQWGAQRKGVAS